MKVQKVNHKNLGQYYIIIICTMIAIINDTQVFCFCDFFDDLKMHCNQSHLCPYQERLIYGI